MILREVKRESKLNEPAFLSTLREEARNSYAVVRRNPLFGNVGPQDFALITPGAGKSAFFVDNLVDDSSKWRTFPHRGGAFKLYNTKEQVDDENHLHVVFPCDGNKLGICTEGSFYRSFPSAQRAFGVSTVDNGGLLEWISNVKSGLKKLLNLKSDTESPIMNNADLNQALETGEVDSYSRFLKVIERLDKVFDDRSRVLRLKKRFAEVELSKEEHEALDDLLASHVTNLRDLLNAKLDPDANGFKSVRIEGYHRPSTPVALWTDRPCLTVRYDKYVDLLKRKKLE